MNKEEEFLIGHNLTDDLLNVNLFVAPTSWYTRMNKCISKSNWEVFLMWKTPITLGLSGANVGKKSSVSYSQLNSLSLSELL